MSTSSPAEASRPPDTTRLQRIALAYWESAALFAAVELDLFTAIARGHDTIAAAAKAIGISPRNAERLMTALTGMTLLGKRGEHYANAPDVARFLVKDSSRYAGPWMLFTKPRWERFGRLTELLRAREETVLGAYAHFTVEDARRYHAATASIGFGAGRKFCRDVDLSERRRLLDLGGGSGAYSITAAKTWPHLEAIVFDLPPVIEVTRGYIAEHGVAERVTTVAGDFTRDKFPSGVDVVLMASNLPQYEPDLVRLVVLKAFAALIPGGDMHLVGETLNDDRSGPLAATLWGLNEAVQGSTGVAHSEADVCGYMLDAGFTGVEVHAFVPGVLSRIVGSKPA